MTVLFIRSKFQTWLKKNLKSGFIELHIFGSIVLITYLWNDFLYIYYNQMAFEFRSDYYYYYFFAFVSIDSRILIEGPKRSINRRNRRSLKIKPNGWMNLVITKVKEKYSTKKWLAGEVRLSTTKSKCITRKRRFGIANSRLVFFFFFMLRKLILLFGFGKCVYCRTSCVNLYILFQRKTRNTWTVWETRTRYRCTKDGCPVWWKV